MKKYFLIVLIFVSSLIADTKIKYDAYNYMSFGFENITYQEKGILSNNKSFLSDSTIDSPVYLSGSLVRMDGAFDFSIDTASTLFPTSSDESWTQDGVLVSTDKLESIISSLKILIQYKYTNNHRFVFGPKYDLNLYKRHTYRDDEGNSVYDDSGNKIALTEERVAALSFFSGYIYESAPHSNGSYRIKISILGGKPIWRNVTNTGFKDISYDTTVGYSYELGGYFGYEIIKGMEIGIFADYDYQIKTGGNKQDDVIWPENELKIFRSGLAFVWNFK